MATRALEDVAADNDVIIASPALLQHLDFLRKWKLADSSVITGRGGMGGGGRGGFAGAGAYGDDDADRPSPQQQAKNAARAKLYTGPTTDKQRQFQDDVVSWADGRAVYVVGADTDLDRLLPGVDRDALTIVRRIPTSKPPAETQNRAGDRFARGRGNLTGVGGRAGGPAGGRGGPMGTFVAPGEEIVIARWDRPATDMLSADDFR
jgi:hypothetical protein